MDKNIQGETARLAGFLLNKLNRVIAETGQSKDNYRCPKLGPSVSKG